MPSSRPALPVADRLTSRRGAWISIVVVAFVMLVLFGLFGRASTAGGNDTAPSDSESAQAAALLDRFADGDEQSLLLVASGGDERRLTEAQLAQLAELAPLVGEQTGHPASPPLTSDDGQVAVILSPMTLGADNAETAEQVAELRALIAEHPIDGVTVWVTGGPAFGADITGAFAGADFTLLIVTILIVAVLLIFTYRSPILWLIPLVVVAFADQLAGRVTAAVGGWLGLQFDAGIISVLVFGAGTNYALLLISRYREELGRDEDHRRALATAWRATAPAIVASNLTVVLALATLVFAVIPGTRGLGIASAVGLVIALGAVLFALPPVLAVCGRKVFWPLTPSPGSPRAQGVAWRAVASRVVRRPVLAGVGGLALLGVLAAGLLGTSVGLSQVDKFRVASESAAGLEVLGEHFPAGEAQPMTVVARTAAADAVADAVRGIDGVIRVSLGGESRDGDLTRIVVTGEPAPGTAESLELVREVREAAHGVPDAHALVGGPVATDLDARDGNERDLLVIAPLVLVVGLLVLTVLLRSLVAPVLLMLVNLASALAAIGAGAWLSRVVFDQHALDLQVPLLSFLFLVALGIDYTIFLVHRARDEAAVWGTRQGMVRAVAGTGGVITSAGIVLAAVFAALGTLPLVTLGQIGLIVAVGVVVDTFVVRTIIVPALFSVVGDRIWWPGRPAAGADAVAAAEAGESGHVGSERSVPVAG